MYNTIIVPTDFSNEEATIQTIIKANELSKHGDIILLHVIENTPSYSLVNIPAESIQDLVPQTRDALRELVHFSKVKAKTEVRHGNSYRQIIAAAKDHDADLIIINSHRPGLQDYLLGSTAAKVVRHTACSVLVER